MRESLCRTGADHEWNHLIPMELSPPLVTPAKTLQQATNALWRAFIHVLNRWANIRNSYEVQHAQHGFATAVRNTVHQIVKVFYQMGMGKQRSARRMVARGILVERNQKKLRFTGTGFEQNERFRKTTENLTVSVVIPTKNAGVDLRSLLSTMKNQKGFKNIEIVVVDSGSNDDTLEIARDFATTIIEIAPSEFSHSNARNLGAGRSTGDYILFTVQDALPPCDTWLRDMYQPIQSYGVVVSSCAESPRRNSDLFYRTLCSKHFTFLDIHNRDRILQKPKRNDYGNVRANVNVSDIACLIRRDVFLKYKFRGDYAEDMDLGLRLINDDYKLALLSSTRIIHSHNRSAYYHLKRGYVDTLSLFKLFRGYRAQAVEAISLMEDILGVYVCLDGLLASALAPSMKSCPMAKLSAIVMGALTAAKPREAIPMKLQANPSVDDSFQRFVETVSSKRCASNTDRVASNGALLSDLRAFVTAMLAYMRQIYEVLDEALLDDFRKSLFKAFAFNIGIRLAAGVSAGSERTRRILQELCVDLRQSI